MHQAEQDSCDAEEQSHCIIGLLFSECKYTVHLAAQSIRRSWEMGGLCSEISSCGFCRKALLICIQGKVSKLVQKGTLQLQWIKSWSNSCLCKNYCQHTADDRVSQEDGFWRCKAPQFYARSTWNASFRNGCSCISASGIRNCYESVRRWKSLLFAAHCWDRRCHKVEKQ